MVNDLNRSWMVLHNAIEIARNSALSNLETAARSSDIKTLRSCNLGMAIFAVGSFSMFEAALQRHLDCKDGFEQLRKVLLEKGKKELADRFDTFNAAINALKHGLGRSHDRLLSQDQSIQSFHVKRANQFFDEGDVSEISALVNVDEDFIDKLLLLLDDATRQIDAATG